MISSITYLKFIEQLQMNDRIILEVCSDRQDSECCSQLDQDFFVDLHQKEQRYTKLKYGRKGKEAEKEMKNIIVDLVSAYTDCIDYFGAYGDAAVAYFQIKIKEINKYYQFLTSQTSQKRSIEPLSNSQLSAKKDLGSISDLTGTELLPQQERQNSIASKEALNHNLMVVLQSQDIKTHLKENMKKEKKIHTVITDSLKQQDDFLMMRKKGREGTKSRAYLSFSENILDFSRSPEASETSELMITDLEALEANSPQELKALMSRNSIQPRELSLNFLET